MNNITHLVDLFIQQGDIEKIIAFYKSDKASRNYINSKLNDISKLLNVSNIDNFKDIVIAYDKSIIETLGDYEGIKYAFKTKNKELIKYTLNGILKIITNMYGMVEDIYYFSNKIINNVVDTYDYLTHSDIDKLFPTYAGKNNLSRTLMLAVNLNNYNIIKLVLDKMILPDIPELRNLKNQGKKLSIYEIREKYHYNLNDLRGYDKDERLLWIEAIESSKQLALKYEYMDIFNLLDNKLNDIENYEKY